MVDLEVVSHTIGLTSGQDLKVWIHRMNSCNSSTLTLCIWSVIRVARRAGRQLQRLRVNRFGGRVRD